MCPDQGGPERDRYCAAVPAGPPQRDPPDARQQEHTRRHDARARLQKAALELFRERGYDRTTAADIAGRAGVTERTFFRHFPDKREVLFDGQAVLVEALTASIADAPTELGPLDTCFGRPDR